ncbi:MAG: hypothetical protein JWL85_423 [Candidatus Saccharibacteria bacterium]|nr:hypothetical protein [Candidatus Saccharibacteria bacterium]
MAKDSITKTKSTAWKIVFIVVTVLAFAGLTAAAGVYYKKYNDLKNHPVSADKAAQDEIGRTISEVGKLYDLPKDETPSIATVKDKEKLKDQPFFAKAENGDTTLIYSKAKLAILYRPGTKQLINVSSVNIQSQVPSVKIIGTVSDRAAVDKILKENFKDQVIVNDQTEAKSSHATITVIDLSGQQGEMTKKLAEGLKGSVGTLPAGEEKPTGVDILIVAGSSNF